MPDLATILAPLYQLLRNSEPWQWDKEQQVTFEKIKEMWIAPKLLVHFETVPMLSEAIALLEQLASVPLTATQIRKITDHNPVLAKVKQYTLKGRPATDTDKQLQPYSSKRNEELCLEDGIPLWDSRVVVPPQ